MIHCGLCYYVGYTHYISPVRVNADVFIKDIVAQVKLTQVFINDASSPVEAMYSFPVPAKATVCGFTMVRGDGTRVVGFVKEKAEAKKTYDTAISEGRTASLATQQTPDVFQIAVGNILQNEEIKIELVYATELTENEQNNSIRFHLPTHIGARYGNAPSNLLQTSSRFLEINVAVELASPIQRIGSSSHPVSTQLGPDPDIAGSNDLPFANYARVSLSTDSPLQKDFVLSMQSAGLDAPRCIAEHHPVQDTVGMVLTLVPKFTLPDRKQQEFIFLVDRSGSMQHSRISAARKALVIMLRSLPYKGTLFQIASFGSRTTMLWPEGSQEYGQETLGHATDHVDTMSANYGGTEIANALKTCLDNAAKDRPTNVIVFTDGDSWDNNTVFGIVRKGIEEMPTTRVFCLGIGDSASTAMCTGIARVGNGASIMVGEDEASITGKVARLAKAARTPPISDVHIDWGRSHQEGRDTKSDDFEMVEHDVASPPTLNLLDDTVNVTELESTVFPPVKLHPFGDVQQSPFEIQTLFPGIRLYVYAILQGKSNVPHSVTLRGTSDAGKIEISIPVTLSTLPNADNDALPTVHALAAHRIIQEYEDGRYDTSLKTEYKDDSLASVVKALVIRLGTTYSIISTHTSFIAVDNDQPTVNHQSEGLRFGRSLRSSSRTLWRSSLVTPSAAPSVLSRATGSRPILPPLLMGHSADGEGQMGATMPQVLNSLGIPPPLRSESVRERTKTGGKAPRKQLAVNNPEDPLEKPTGYKTIGRDREREREEVEQSPQRRKMARSEQIFDEEAEGKHDVGTNMNLDDMGVLEKLARTQAFDGGFLLTAEVLHVLGLRMEIVKDLFTTEADVIVATALVVAFIDSKMMMKPDLGDAWEGIRDKARDYLKDLLQGDDSAVQEIVATASGLF